MRLGRTLVVLEEGDRFIGLIRIEGVKKCRICVCISEEERATDTATLSSRNISSWLWQRNGLMSSSRNNRFNLVRYSRCHRFVNIYLGWRLNVPRHNIMWQRVGRFWKVGFTIRSGICNYINSRGDSGHCLKFGFWLPEWLKLCVSLSCIEIVIVYAVKLRWDVSGLCVKNQRYTGGVMRRVAH